MRNKNTFGDKLANWKLIATNVAPRLAEMTHLQPVHAELLAVVAEAEALEAEQETIRGRLRALSKLRADVSKRAGALRSRVGAHLKGTFGYTSTELVQFGYAPLKTEGKARPVRRRSNAEPAEVPVETPVPAPGTPR